jgi:hypothetical protein
VRAPIRCLAEAVAAVSAFPPSRCGRRPTEPALTAKARTQATPARVIFLVQCRVEGRPQSVGSRDVTIRMLRRVTVVWITDDAVGNASEYSAIFH